MIIHATNQNFEQLIKEQKSCVVDFFATWCGPCRMLGEEMEKIKDQATIIKVDVDECMALASAFGIDVVPTMIIFKNGKPTLRTSGYMPAKEILKLLEGNK